jgi:hypothetical protein
VPLKTASPACPCCEGPCAPTCFTVTACGKPAEGATVTVKTAGGTTVASGTTDADGRWCVDLSSFTGQTLYATVDYRPADYFQLKGVLLGNFCGKAVAYTLAPGSDTCTDRGMVHVRVEDCDGNPVSGAHVSIRRSFDGSLITGGTTGAGGEITWHITAPSAIRVDVVKAWGGGTQTVATPDLSLTCTADITFRLSASYPATHCDDEVAVTQTDAAAPETRCCCLDCAPADSLACTLDLDDPYGKSADGQACTDPYGRPANGPQCDLDGIPRTIASTTPQTWTGTSTGVPVGASVADYTMTCTGAGLTLRKRLDFACCDDWCAALPCCVRDPDHGHKLGIRYEHTVTATSVTCEPFAATFDFPAASFPLFQMVRDAYGGEAAVPCGTIELPEHSVTVTEP